ncbi:leucine-rich repeat and WD repeat-containing protein 1-like [Physella acuta]|uniref:leucine-rich repeat and WD repeat-containing protein 1-like n=1 Tax=Physella acuta TaxID=109671 RepID=UPI0027DDAA9E|nr:leucine-rich repeat and WD repeat-containing protein 1-like [Physella acuta]XP_059144713.1 leucine-rich repeat and WD repeat-containing protein 1-like [Physella acuta]XP_059144714.1 leucine-rich repeat and WD repeat-containing protein 1-like [Physella acuta]
MARRGIKRKAPDLGHLPSLGDFTPTMFLRCHNQKEEDDETKIWKCAFEPSLENPDETTNLLATCGGKTVCIIDVNTQQVLKRFQDTDKYENFYTLAWTSIELAGKKKVNILAVAGEGAAIKLIYPSQLLMYATIRGHKKYISCLLFHPTLTRLLFSGSRDGFVYLWDIGIPDKAPSASYVPLLKISLQDSFGDALNLIFCERSQLLIAGAERGCVGWVVGDCQLLTPVRRAKVIERADIVFQHPKSKTQTIDGLINLPGDLIATKQVGSGEILIWDLTKHVQKEIKEVLIEPMIKLKYPQTSVKYLNLGFSNGLLGVGDDQGNLLLYNIQNVLKKHSEDEENVWEASNILEWPNIVNLQSTNTPRQELVVNTVAISSSHEYITGGTDNNLVCIWKRDEDVTQDGETEK